MTGPRLRNPKKGRNAAEYNAYMRQYMRRYREGGRRLFKHEKPVAQQTAKAAYIPSKNPPPCFSDLTAVLMGDPPIGRRALDAVKQAACP